MTMEPCKADRKIWQFFEQSTEWSTAVTRDQVRDHDVATATLLCYKVLVLYDIRGDIRVA